MLELPRQSRTYSFIDTAKHKIIADIDCVWNVMAHAQKPDSVFRRKEQVHLNRRGVGGGPVQSTAGSRGVRVCGGNAGYTMFRGSVKGSGYPLHSSVSPSISLPCVTVCYHISTVLYISWKFCTVSFLVTLEMVTYSVFGLCFGDKKWCDIVVFFLLGDSSTPEFYVPTFRNTLFHLRRQVKGGRTRRKFEFEKRKLLFRTSSLPISL